MILRANRRKNAMCTNDSYVSPYLRRPLRPYEQFMREQARETIRGDGANGNATRNPVRKGGDDVEPCS